MKKLLIIITFLMAGTCYGQNITDSLKNKFVYCEIVGTQKFLSTKVIVTVDYGEERAFFQNMAIKDEETGKAQSFNSMVDALNYMGSKGWEFVQAYVVSTGTNNYSVYHWLLKKKIK